MAYVLGVDIGSGYSKAVICLNGHIYSWAVMPSGGDYKGAARAVAETALKKAGLSMEEVSSIIATGYGANMVDFANHTVTDISSHATGINRIFPNARAVIDIGHQYSRAISIDEKGRVANFLMNEKCAGGSGKFLQIIARMLHIGLNEMGERSLRSTQPVEFTTGCAVFAESEAVSRIAEGANIDDIIAGVHRAMASKIVNLIIRLGIKGGCAVTGGGANDKGLVNSIEKELGSPLLLPDYPELTGAYGAALLTPSVNKSSLSARP